ncbi:hypothetical protein ACIPJM_04305 [Streptomyces halstedii]|uniref:hypothetical protein n=1 Tax=Streptomyces halstedii TaxID=1944 RepID=UPI0038067791
MNTLDSLFLAAGAMSANATAIDHMINTTLVYGPGIALTTGTLCAIRSCRWAANRYHQWINDRADRRHYTAVAFRLNRVADRADAFLAMPEAIVTARLEAHYALEADPASKEDR